jgi:ATP-dependent protease HslVU (ClpYQ) ATPase subunit
MESPATTHGFESHSPRLQIRILRVTLIARQIPTLTRILYDQEASMVSQFAALAKNKQITKYNPKPCFRQALLKLAKIDPVNANVICDYIIVE